MVNMQSSDPKGNDRSERLTISKFSFVPISTTIVMLIVLGLAVASLNRTSMMNSVLGVFFRVSWLTDITQPSTISYGIHGITSSVVNTSIVLVAIISLNKMQHIWYSQIDPTTWKRCYPRQIVPVRIPNSK